MLNRLKDKILKRPVILGIVCILLIVLFVLWRWDIYTHAQIPSSITTEDMDREETVGSYTLPCEPIAYFLKAAGDQDLDQALRAFPISELNSNTNLTQILTREGVFNFDLAPAFSSISDTYSMIGKAEITAYYAELYTEFLDKMPDLSDMELVRFAFKRLDEDEKQYYNALTEITGAKKFQKRYAFVRAGGKLYRIPFVVEKCKATSWKVYDIDIENIKKTSNKKMNKFKDLTQSEEPGKRDRERIGVGAKEQIDAGEALLPQNYSLADVVYGETPEKLMRQFELYVQKDDTGALLAFGNTGDEMRISGQLDPEQLILQGEFADKLKEFYYTILLGEEVTEETSVYDLGYKETTLAGKLKPFYFFYSSMAKMAQISENEYYVYWKYESEYYRFTFCFQEFEQGWQISDIKDGVKLTDEEYLQETSV